MKCNCSVELYCYIVQVAHDPATIGSAGRSLYFILFINSLFFMCPLLFIKLIRDKDPHFFTLIEVKSDLVI